MATAEWAPPEVTDDWTPPEATTDWMPDEVAGDQQSAGRTALNALVAGTADVAAMPFQALRNVQTTVGDIAQKYAGTPGRVFADAVTGTGANPLVSQFAADKGGQLRQSAQENFPVDAERNPIAATIGGAVPQVVGMIGAHMALGPAAPLVLGGAMEAQGGFETADQIGVTSPEARLATAAAFAGTGALLERMGGIGGKEVIGSALRRGAIGVGSEMLEEPATGGAQDAITALAATEDPNNPGFTKTGYDLAQLNPSNADYWQKRKLEAIGGAVGGTMFAGVQALAGTPQEAKPPPLPETITSLQEEITPEDIAGFDEAAAEPALQPVPPVSVESGMFEAPQMEGQEYDLTPPSNAIVNEVIPTVPQSGASTVDEVIAGSTPADGAISQPVLPEQQAAPEPQAAVEALPVVEEPIVAAPVVEQAEQTPVQVEAPIPTKATETLRSITAALPPAKWTPEVFSQAERYYQTRDAADIENLTPIQRKYINEALYQADPQAAEVQDAIDREAERKIRLQASSEKNMAKRDAVKAEQAETWAESYINDARSRVSMGLDPVLLSAYVIKGAGIVAKGAKNYAQFTMKMVAKYGNAVKRYLRQAWQAITTREMPKLGGGKVRVRTNEGGFVAGYGGQVLPNPTPATPPPLPPEAQGPEFEPGGRMKQSQSAYGPTPQRQDEGVGEYEARENAFFLQAANDYLATHTLEEATAVVESNIPPPGMDLDYMPAIGERLIHKLNNMIASGTDLEKVQANALVERAETAWTGKASQDVGRAQQQRSAAKQRMDAYAEVMAARGLLVKRAKEKIEPRFEGGTTSAVTKLKKVIADVDKRLPDLMNDLRIKMFPGMTWRDIFSELPAVQKDRQKEIYRRLLLDERLKGLDKTQRLALAIELDRAWQKERQKVFMAELEREGILGQKDKEDTKKIKQAAPRLLRLMNVGLMNSELFREAIAKEYGIKTISAEEAAILRKMGEEIQLAPDGIPRQQKQEKFMRRLQDLTGATKMEILESWWTAAVLSGWRTINDIALSIANGIEDVVAGSIVTAIRTGRYDVARKSIGALLGNLPTAFREAKYYMKTGDRSVIPSFDAQIKASLEDGTKLIGNAGRYLREQGGIKGGFGTFMEFVERIMTALDHINSSSTYEGAKMMAIARNPELWQKYTNVTKGDLDIIRQRARDELTNGKPASNKAERVAEDAQVKILVDRMFPVDLINQAREIGRESALQGDPQGIVGKALEALTAITSKPRQVLESMEKETTDANNNRSRKLVMFALRRVAPLTKILTGTKFVRTVGQSINRNVSYIPGLGWVIRSGEASMNGAKQDILVAKQFIGFVVGLTLLAALRDQDDEEENLTIEGSWKGMDASKRGQRLAEGFQPNTISWRDSSGRRVSVNYMQWGIAGIMATLGAMEDQRKYFAGEKAELDILVSSLAAGLLAWTDKAQLQGIQAIFSESPYSSSDVGGNMLKRLNKYASSTVGGLVPRIAKDIDAVLSPELRDSSEWWMKWAAQVPMLRELSSGKRMNIFAEDIKLDRTPFSRVVQFSTTDPAYRTLGMLNERDIWLSDPSSGIRKVKMPGNTQREMTKLEKDRYQLDVGKAYKQFIIEQGERLLSMDREKAKELVERRTSMIRDMAARRATMK